MPADGLLHRGRRKGSLAPIIAQEGQIQKCEKLLSRRRSRTAGIMRRCYVRRGADSAQWANAGEEKELQMVAQPAVCATICGKARTCLHQRRFSLRQLNGHIARRAQEGQTVANRRRGDLAHGRSAGSHQPVTLTFDVAGGKGKVEVVGVNLTVIWQGRNGVVVQFDHAARLIGEEVGAGARRIGNNDAQPQIVGQPTGQANGVVNVDGCVFEFHNFPFFQDCCSQHYILDAVRQTD